MVGPVPVSMSLLVTHLLDNEPCFIRTASGIRAAVRIDTEFRKSAAARTGETVYALLD